MNMNEVVLQKDENKLLYIYINYMKEQNRPQVGKITFISYRIC